MVYYIVDRVKEKLAPKVRRRQEHDANQGVLIPSALPVRID
jgi:hypothetical protein